MQADFSRSGTPSSPYGIRFLLVAGLIFASSAIMSAAEARSRSKGDSAEKKQKADEPAPPSGPMFFIISVGKQRVSVYANNGLYARAPVSTGRPDHPTPMGIFNILEKDRHHRSNIYSSAPMPFMQRVTWSGVAMHEGVLPGYPASHGCIRMPHDFAKRMFGLTQGNERVIITRQDIAPAAFSHPRLPVPKLMPIGSSDNIASSSSQMLQNALASTDLSRAPGRVNVAAKADGSDANSDAAAQRLLNPFEFAKAMKGKAAKRAEEAAAAVNPAHNAAEAKVREAKAAAVDLRKAEIALANAKDRFENADKQLKKASGDEAVTSATAAKTAAEAKVKEAEAAFEAAQRAKNEKDADAASAIRAVKDVDNVRKAAADAVKSWNRRLAPISVFISRKTQRLYVRQGYIKVFDIPVTIREPEKPLGTHLYMAMQPAKDGAAAATPSLQWIVLTIPEATADDSDEGRGKRRRKNHGDDDNAVRTVQPSGTAAAALDRIEIPEEVAGKISEMLWAGGSLIVSDAGMSRETGDHTDFIILTR